VNTQKKKLFWNTAANYTYTFVNMAIGFALFPFILHTIGGDLYGIYLLIIAFSGYLNLMELGVGTTTVKFVSAHLARGEQREINSLLTNSLLFYSCIGLVMGAIFVACAFLAITAFSVPEGFLPVARRAFILAGIGSLIVWPLRPFRNVVEGKQKYVLVSGVVGLFALVRLIVIFLFLEQDSGLLFLTGIFFATEIAQNFLLTIYAFKSMYFLKLDPRLISRNTYKRIFGFSWTLSLIQIFERFVYQTDKIIIGLFLPISSVALYEGAFKIHSVGRVASGLMGEAAIPAASSLDASSAVQKVKSLLIRGNRYAVMLILPLSIAVLVFAKYIVIHWLGAEYASIIFPVQLFAGTTLLMCGTALNRAMLIATGKTRFLLWFTMAKGLGNLILSVGLVLYMHSFVGVVWGTVLTNVAGYPIYLTHSLKLLDIKLGTFLKNVILSLYPYVVVPLVLGLAAVQIRPPHGLFETGAYVMGMIVSYWVGTFFFALQKDEREDLKRLFMSFGDVSKG